MALFKHLSV